MRVCMLSYSFYEGDNRVMRYSDALVRAGHHVDVAALKTRTQVPHEMVRGVHVHRIQLREFPEHPGKIAYLLRLWRFLLKSAVWLARQHLRHHYDLIHVHSVPDFEVFAAIVPRLLGCKIILDIHDIVPEFYCSKFEVRIGSAAFKLLVFVERLSIAFCDHVIIANHLWYDRLVQRSVAPEKCTVILNYPDTSIFHASVRCREDGFFLMMYPGTINHHQGLDIAVRAFHRVRSEMPRARFDIYGDGPDRPALERLIEALGMSDRVRLLNVMPMVNIARVMAQADLGVVPKRSDTFGNEAFSTKSLEFMSLGVPLLISATKIDRYYFDDSVVQFFRSGDEADLAAKMVALYRNVDRRKSLADNGLRFVEPYSWDKRQEEYFEIIRHLVDGRMTESCERFFSKAVRNARTSPTRHRLRQRFSIKLWDYWKRKAYYSLRPLLPRPLQIALRRRVAMRILRRAASVWPIDTSAGRKPAGWIGWPGKRQFALVLTHDVESMQGVDRCLHLAEIEARLGFVSSYNFVPERYLMSPLIRHELSKRGFEVGVHDLTHDGRLFESQKIFLKRVPAINQYLRSWQAVGFRAGSMYHNLAWMHRMDIEYDSSTFDIDPFEPQPDGIHTVFPVWMPNYRGDRGFVELPYTMAQDLTLFVLLEHKDAHVWREKLDWIVAKGGMALLNAHPDYMHRSGEKPRIDEYPCEYYVDFLKYIKEKYKDQYWNAIPRDVARYWRSCMASLEEN